MVMKKRFLVVSVVVTVLLVLSISLALAEESPAPAPSEERQKDLGGCCACPADPIVTGDVYYSPMNRYIYRGQNLSQNKWVSQGGVDLTYREWTLSYWTNFEHQASDGRVGHLTKGITENDIYINYAYNPWWVPTKTDGTPYVQFNVGNNLYDYNNETTNEVYAKANLNMPELLNPTIAVYWDWDRATRAGLYYTASLSYKYDIERKYLDVTAGALVSYNQRNWNAAYDPNSSDYHDGAYNGFHDYELTAGLDWLVDKHTTISPSYQFSNALSTKARDIAGIKPQHCVGIKVQWSF